MLFNEVYGSYYNAVAAVLTEAVRGGLTAAVLDNIVRRKAFAESALTIPDALTGGTWPLLRSDLSTPLRHAPTMPLTALQKRWLKSLLADPRIRLFSPPEEGLEDVEPLYPPDCFVRYDRYGDGDPYGSTEYVEHFHTVLAALREGLGLRIRYRGRVWRERSYICVPERLEYSSKDDKFRLLAATPHGTLTVNLARIVSCERLPGCPDGCRMDEPEMRTLVLELVDERNALERALLHFSDLEKETARLDDRRYRLTLRYERDDEIELLIRVLSFGPMLRVLSPDSFIELVRERLDRQFAYDECNTGNYAGKPRK